MSASSSSYEKDLAHNVHTKSAANSVVTHEQTVKCTTNIWREKTEETCDITFVIWYIHTDIMILLNGRQHFATDVPEHLNTLQSSATPLRQDSLKKYNRKTNGIHPTVRPNNNRY
jgi:hypothetical protein